MIHKLASIDAKAKIHEEVSVGAYTVIGPEVQIGKGSKIHSHVVIEGPTSIGSDNEIFQFASIGGDPQDKKYKGEKTYLEIGNENVIREGVTINRGTVQENSLTKIGSKNLIMAYCHVAHDCEISDEVVLVNNASLAGCVKIDKGAILGGFTLVHQFCHVGQFSFSAMGSSVGKDIPAFVRVSGNPALPRGLNTTGIKRLNFKKEVSDALKETYKILYLRNLKLNDAISEITQRFNKISEVQVLIDSITSSDRGIVR
ncbi:acyl-ACP--UDP-N-acetylglucosamine O-acyltransferase [SAR86 cluster bacterium]|nr:acyl-ACP--UDP-N-acetylglucosamine O-acyltransferase [SAR86 cluster bacterium]